MRTLQAAACAALAAGASAAGGRPVPEIVVDLDVAPEKRFAEVVTHFNASIWKFYGHIDNLIVKGLLKWISGKRGPEPIEELLMETRGYAQLTGLPEYGMHAMQFLYELNTLMVPKTNASLPKEILAFLPTEFHQTALPQFPWTGPGCTGIIALDKSTGQVNHARNLDFSPAAYLQDLVYTGIFKKGGKELFRAQMIAGYSSPLTGLKKGPNGFSYEINTRYPSDKNSGNVMMWHNLFDKKLPLNGWVARQALQTAANFEEFVEKLSTEPYVATMYNIISGVKKGVILARDPAVLYRKLELGKANPECRDDYIIMTNFDYWNHDNREWWDPTGGKGIGHPRRPAAQRLLNASSTLTPEVLHAVLSDFEVMAKDTIFQAMINVEAGSWDVTMPPCTDCPKPKPAGGEDTVFV